MAFSFQKPNKLLHQNYETLLETCLKNKCLFKDENFPADLRSIGMGSLLQKLPPKLQWKRPHVSDVQGGWLEGREVQGGGQGAGVWMVVVGKWG
uniref:Calpain catalytic domain-containing protein n=1 Tax=Gopherus evgoodei TaxID=1825980 RepID=A0A8C4WSM6_9SAUR